ncbi:hypothetical protein K4H28_14485 [Deefgea tanakiae]|uniref:Uncharacterized protein n=2 Tax=Deefgea tanakiae TaxID=2865840 RepID=A0ABX8Z4G1_9NEIS|nr:hypothetical protein K4H28_14485 [Deefgea tanakiae]
MLNVGCGSMHDLEAFEMVAARGLKLSNRPGTVQCPANEMPQILPLLLSIYARAYYFGSITRYRPHHYPSITDSAFGSRVQDFITGQPQQFLYLLASEFAKREIAKPSIH